MIKRVIDYKKCIGCKKCVKDCINAYITDLGIDGNETKYPFFKGRGVCIDCGHCDAICPSKAITVYKNEEEIIETDLLLEQMARKRTVRIYDKTRCIEENKLSKIIYAGQSAPTDRNRKTVRIILVKTKLKKIYDTAVEYLWKEVKKTGSINPLFTSTQKMAENRDEVLWNAEYLVLLVGNVQYCVDAAIAAERMQLEADYIGISSGYRGDMKFAINNMANCKEELGIRSNEEVLVAFAMGYSMIKYTTPSVKINKKVIYQ